MIEALERHERQGKKIEIQLGEERPDRSDSIHVLVHQAGAESSTHSGNDLNTALQLCLSELGTGGN